MNARLPGPRRRRQLLDVALEVFARKGFHATSMNEVAEAAGVTKPVLYQHFRSKRELYLELLSDEGVGLLEAISKAVAEEVEPLTAVEAGFAAYFRLVAERRSAFTLLFGSGARRDAEFADAVRRVEDAIADSVAAMIDADIDPAQKRVLAAAIVGAAEGVSRWWVASGTDLDPVVLARQVAQLTWAGLRGVKRVEACPARYPAAMSSDVRLRSS